MEQQSKLVFAKAQSIYNSEMNSIIANVGTKDLDTFKKTQKKMEEELKKLIQKELKGYSKINELTQQLIVCQFINVLIDKNKGRLQKQEEGIDNQARKGCTRNNSFRIQKNNGRKLWYIGRTLESF